MPKGRHDHAPRRTGKKERQLALAQCHASARLILRNLGVSKTMIPRTFKNGEFVKDKPERVPVAPPPVKRFRRTKAELEQLRQFTEWQIGQRRIKANETIRDSS